MNMSAEPADRLAESLLAFWAEAGVDALLLDEPFDRIEAGRIQPPRPVDRKPATVTAHPAARTASSASDEAAIEQARRLAAGANDLAALRDAIENFDGCALKSEGATRSVFYRGQDQAPLMVIGEGPGAEEDARGEPFVGRAGQLLDRMLEAAGLKDRVFITNSVFWRTPGNRNPTPQEQAVCAPFLERAIALVRPRMILLVGGPSTKAMLKRDEGILSLRGRWFDWKSSDGQFECPALPTLHPAFLLRQPAAKKKAWSDLITLTERLDRPQRPDA
jgi:DNA polymerase